jgi:hypothetical protein
MVPSRCRFHQSGGDCSDVDDVCTVGCTDTAAASAASAAANAAAATYCSGLERRVLHDPWPDLAAHHREEGAARICALRIPRLGGEEKPGTSHPRFKVGMTSADAVRFKCEQAGIPQAVGPNKKSDRNSTVYVGHGPMMAYHFCQTQKYKKLGQGSGALMAPGKFRTDSDTLVFAVPPITVTHNAVTWVMTVDFYLCVFNGEGNGQTGRITLPPNPNFLYGGQDVESWRRCSSGLPFTSWGRCAAVTSR